jgi:hypothetical protein
MDSFTWSLDEQSRAGEEHYDPSHVSVYDQKAATDPSEEGYTREDLETHIREEFSTFSWLLEPMLERVGFEIRDVELRGGTYSAYTCVKR